MGSFGSIAVKHLCTYYSLLNWPLHLNFRCGWAAEPLIQRN